MLYPYSTPLILTDDIFKDYGGHMANTARLQRQAAYVMAEQAATTEIGAFLARTTVTGTYDFSYQLTLDHGYIHRIFLTTFLDFEEDVLLVVTGTANEYVAIRNADYGIVDILDVPTCHSCPHQLGLPYKVRMVYETGLTSGTSYLPNILLGLVTYADLILNEIIGYGNEAPGDAGVNEFSNQDYTEKRKPLTNSVNGFSFAPVGDGYSHQNATPVGFFGIGYLSGVPLVRCVPDPNSNAAADGASFKSIHNLTMIIA